MVTIKRYTAEDKPLWDSFVNTSKNGTFLFLRDYMDYHSDRFCDHSLLFLHDGKLFALLPAHECVGDSPEAQRELCSHFGLSYGGLIMNADSTAALVIECFRQLKEYLQAEGFHTLYYKCIPWCYHQLPSEEDLYAMTYVFDNVKLMKREIATLIMQRNKPRWRKDRRRALKRAQANGLQVIVQQDFSEFWQLLNQNLADKHNAKPVHTLNEINLLRSRFPQNIKLLEARKDGKLLGGLVIYITKQVVRGQYSSATTEGKALGAMDIIKEHILNLHYTDYPFFDFGISTEDSGRYLNEALISQKEGFGGRGMVYDTYDISL